MRSSAQNVKHAQKCLQHKNAINKQNTTEQKNGEKKKINIWKWQMTLENLTGPRWEAAKVQRHLTHEAN